MSILIRGMQMPKNCGVCPLRGCGYLCCPDTENERLIRTEYMCSDDLKRPDWCPITDLGSHGDLIDRDTLKNAVLKWMPPDPCGREEKEFPFETDICVSMMMEIEEQDAVIEAEGVKE